MRHLRTTFVLTALLLTAVGCIHWTRSTPVITERPRLWQSARDAVSRRYTIDESKTDMKDGYLITKWKYTMAANYLEGFRTKVELELEPYEGDKGKKRRNKRWVVKLRVYKELNENVSQPMLKAAAEWGSNIYWEEEELRLMQHIVIAFRNLTVSDYALKETQGPRPDNQTARETRPLAQSRAVIWRSVLRVCNSYYNQQAAHEKAGKYVSQWALRGDDAEVADIRTRLTVRLLSDTTTKADGPVFRLEVRVDKQKLDRDDKWINDGRDTIGEDAIAQEIEKQVLSR